MKFYIASSFSNMNKVRELSSRLKEIGYEQTYDWTQNNRASSLEALQKIGLLEKKAVIEADFLIVLTPAGKGSHIELGMAIGAEIPVYLYSEDGRINNFHETSTFYHLPEVNQVIGDFEKIIDKVQVDFPHKIKN
ncbi:nucleoside 2-deoxyribosyltransferase [Alkalihalobacillus pseudalcaliphilus]|uniref:nucleoside 2-deoxyribosyltransferase n=1 Tax=Alkalihalobacillus pseudalcaliphilus TaxID=79884 RepID=UPI00064D7AEA|nr:nucleoside 2-deoxyribosyltransferase [Alkalihalobacillus pseudalcaliphilus]KMK75805.1 group-specific protein [Alkalihalobacillus pseudalcaliphilus]